METPPTIATRPTTRTVHGVELHDEYAWLRAKNWRDVLRDPACLPDEIRTVLELENAYAARHLAPMSDLVSRLVAEMRGRMKEDDETVPMEDGGWHYYRRYRDGGQHPIVSRKRGEDGEENIILDGDLEAAGHSFFSISEAVHSPSHDRLAWSVDLVGSELYEIRLRDCAAAQELPDVIRETDGSIVWMRDGQGFYYVHVDENHRTCRVFRHMLGRAEDELVLAENDPAWFVGIGRASSGAFAVITLSDHDATECHLLDLDDPCAVPRLVERRMPGLRYSVAHRGSSLFIRTNADGAVDFKIVLAPVEAPGRENWVDIVPHVRGRMIVTLSVFPHHVVRLEREEGLPRIAVRDLSDGEEYTIAFAEEAYSLTLEHRLTFDTNILRFTYTSMTTPRETFDFDLFARTRRLRKRQVVPSGHDPRSYVTRRLFAEAPDGAHVPITVLHQAGQVLDGTAPLLLYGYGAYGHALPASFSTNALSLVDRGFVYAIAHVRGGTEKGWHWYVDGKLDKKTNTFSDFLAVARKLIAEDYTGAGRIVAQGGSAGGLLMGAIANLAPELFAGIVAAVPFVDVLNTILDADLPLTPPEWLEWGNPISDKSAFETIRSYSPYDNIAARPYPPILALCGLTDPRVTYWEPAKWVARLRANTTGSAPILLKTNMGAGHGGRRGASIGWLRLPSNMRSPSPARRRMRHPTVDPHEAVTRDAHQLSMKAFSSAIDANR